MKAAFAGVFIDFEVIPGGEMADQRLGIETGEFFLTHGERHDRNVRRFDALVAELLVERHVGVAVDGGHHRRLLAGRTELLDFRHFGLPVGEAERRVVDHDVLVLHPFLLEVGFEDLVGGARIDESVPSSTQRLTVPPSFDQIVDGRDRLLVRRGAGIDVVARFPRPHIARGRTGWNSAPRTPAAGFARRQRPAAEHPSDLVDRDQLACLSGEDPPSQKAR